MAHNTKFKEFVIEGIEIKSIDQLHQTMDDILENIKNIKTEIGMISAATPKDIVPDNECWEPLEYVRYRLNDLFIDLWEYYSLLTKCYLIEDNFNNIVEQN